MFGLGNQDHPLLMRRLLLAVLWGYAAWVWTSMAHVFLGTPDVGPIIAAAVALWIVARPIIADLRIHGVHPKSATTKATR
jgi:hypothetical protein